MMEWSRYRHGNTDFYGKGKTVDTSKKFTVVTQFHGSGSNLDSISQYFIQDGKKIEVPGSKHVKDGSKIDAEFCDAAKDVFKDNRRFQDMGGLKQMGDATGKGMVLVMSVWDDVSRIPKGLTNHEPRWRDRSAGRHAGTHANHRRAPGILKHVVAGRREVSA